MGKTNEIEVVIPEDHRLTIEVPLSVRPGPTTLVFLPASERQTPPVEAAAGGRLAALAAAVAKDPRSFSDLPAAERRSRLQRLRGMGRGLTSGSEGLARQKQEEVALEERLLGS